MPAQRFCKVGKIFTHVRFRLFYTYEKQTNLVFARFQLLRGFLDIATLNAETVDATLTRRLPDIEDGFQFEAALTWNATHLITRNVKDFPQGTDLIIQTPTDYLERL